MFCVFIVAIACVSDLSNKLTSYYARKSLMNNIKNDVTRVFSLF